MKAPRPKIRYCWFRKFGNTFLRLDLDEGTVAWIDHATPQYIQLEGFDRNSVVLDADTFCNIATCFEAIPYAPTMALRRRQLRERLEELEKLIRFFPRDVSGWQPHASFPTTRRGATESAAASALPLSGSSTASSPSVRKISTVLVGQGGSAAVLRIGADGGRGHAVRTLYRNGGTVVADAVALLATRATDDDFQQLGAPEPSIGATVAAALKRLHSQLVGQRTWSSMSERLLAMQKAAWAIAEKRSGGAARSPYRRRRLSSEIAQGFLCPHCHSEFVAMDTLLEHVQLCQPSDDVLKASDSRTYVVRRFMFACCVSAWVVSLSTLLLRAIHPLNGIWFSCFADIGDVQTKLQSAINPADGHPTLLGRWSLARLLWKLTAQSFRRFLVENKHGSHLPIPKTAATSAGYMPAAASQSSWFA